MASQYLQQLTATSDVLQTYLIPISDDPASTGRLKKMTVAQLGAGLFLSVDAVINSVNIGLGGGSISTNLRAGSLALNANTTGNHNLAIGSQAFSDNISGSFNVALGYQAGKYFADGTTSLTTAINSIYIGSQCYGFNDSDDNAIVIGCSAVGEGANKTVIGNSSTISTRVFGTLYAPTAVITTSITDPLIIGGTAASSSLTLKSTSGVGTTDAIIFATGNNGATTGVRVSTGGALIIGTTGQTVPQGILSCHTDTANNICYARASTNASGINFLIQKARGTTLSPTAVSAGDVVGNILFQAYNDAYRTCANISVQVDTGVGATGADTPGVMILSTTPDGSSTQLEAMRVTSTQNIGIGTGSTVSARLHVIATTEQARIGYDSSNYYSTTVSSAGVVTLNAVGSSSRFIFSDNVGIGVSAFGTSAANVFGIFNGTEPSTSPADMIQLYSVDLSAGNATLGLRTETAVVTESVTSDRTLSIRINGTTYKLCLKA